MSGEVNGSAPPDEQPEPDDENPRADYQRAVARLQNILARRAKEADAVNVLAAEQDLAIRSCELSAIQTLLIRAGVCDAADIYREAAIAAVSRGSRILAELETQPRVLVPAK